MMSLPFRRAFLWFKEGANQWERGMIDYFGEGLMPGGFTFTRCQVAWETSVSCNSRSSRTLIHFYPPLLLLCPLNSHEKAAPVQKGSGLSLWLSLQTCESQGKEYFAAFFSGADWGLGSYWLVAASLWDGKKQWNLRKPIISRVSSDSQYLNCTLNFWVAGRNPSSYGTKTREGEESRGWEVF